MERLSAKNDKREGLIWVCLFQGIDVEERGERVHKGKEWRPWTQRLRTDLRRPL